MTLSMFRKCTVYSMSSPKVMPAIILTDDFQFVVASHFAVSQRRLVFKFSIVVVLFVCC